MDDISEPRMTPIIADVVWPALFLEQRLFSWWVIGLGLFIEFFFVRSLTKLSLKQCFVANLAMNAASALLGLLLIPLAGIAWEFFPGIIVYKLFNVGTFNPCTWAATFLFAVFINAAQETFVLGRVFKQETGKRVFWWLCLANSFSIALAFGSLYIHPPRP